MADRVFEGLIVAGTGKALLFHGYYWEKPLWLPRSQVEIEPDGDSFVIRVTKWLCDKNELFEFYHYSAEQIEARSNA